MKRQPLRASYHPATTRSNVPGACIFNLPLHLRPIGIPTKLRTAQVTVALKPHWRFNVYSPYVIRVDRPRTHMEAYLVRPCVSGSIRQALDPPQTLLIETAAPSCFLPSINNAFKLARCTHLRPASTNHIQGHTHRATTAAQVTAGLKPIRRFNIYAPMCGERG